MTKIARVGEPGGIGTTTDDIGATAGDYNNDGKIDLFVTGGGVSTLYRNNGDGTFTDVAALVKLYASGVEMTPIFLDYDRDGYLDLFIATLDKNILYHNNKGETFTDVTETASVGDSGYSYVAAFFFE